MQYYTKFQQFSVGIEEVDFQHYIKLQKATRSQNNSEKKCFFSKQTNKLEIILSKISRFLAKL